MPNMDVRAEYALATTTPARAYEALRVNQEVLIQHLTANGWMEVLSKKPISVLFQSAQTAGTETRLISPSGITMMMVDPCVGSPI